ncbi:MAG: hypothetical protein ACFFAO_02170 [Candidatus Hermodarchaeota archaeon]
MQLSIKDRIKHVVVFGIKEGNTYAFFKNIGIRPNTKLVKYDSDNVFVVDIENPTYKRGNIKYYCIDINSKQISFESKEDGKVYDGKIKIEDIKESKVVSSKITKAIFLDEIILQLARATTKEPKQTYDYRALTIGAIIGGLIGFIVAIFLPIG